MSITGRRFYLYPKSFYSPSKVLLFSIQSPFGTFGAVWAEVGADWGPMGAGSTIAFSEGNAQTVSFLINLNVEGYMASVKRKIVRNTAGGAAW